SVSRGFRRKPIEQPRNPRDLRQQHHADEEEIDVEPLEHPRHGSARREQPQTDERQGASDRPDSLRQSEWPQDDPCGGQGADTPDRKIGHHAAKGIGRPGFSGDEVNWAWGSLWAVNFIGPGGAVPNFFWITRICNIPEAISHMTVHAWQRNR